MTKKTKLYTIKVGYDIVVASTGKKPLSGDIDAWVDYVMSDKYHRENLEPKVVMKLVKDRRGLPKGWIDSIPFGDETGITCKEILAGREALPNSLSILDRLQKQGSITDEERTILELASE